MKELAIPLQADDGRPLYEQIYEYIRNEIVDGKISHGEKLPSSRMLARNLSVSRSTVNLAYDQLVSEGYVETVAGSGYYVCDIRSSLFEFHGKKPERVGSLTDGAGANVGGRSAGDSGKQYAQMCREPHYRYDFSPYATEWSDFSMNAWRKAIKAMLQEDMEDLFLSGSPEGEENLRQAISDYLHRSRGVDCELHQIVVGAGNEYLLMLLYQMLGGDCRVAMESPTYLQAYQIFQNLGWEVSPIPMDESGMTLAGLGASGAQLAYIMPSHQFPLGNVMPMKRRMELLQWAGEAEGRYIIEDDYDSEFRYKGKPIPSLQGSDPYGRVIYLGTFSKSIAPAIRVSYMVLPPGLIRRYRERCGSYSSTVSRTQQQILFHFMKDGYFERHLNKMRGIYRTRHDTLLGELKGMKWVKRIWGENAGLHVLVELVSPKPEEQLIREAKAAGIRVYGLGEYSIRKEPVETGEYSIRQEPVETGEYSIRQEPMGAGDRVQTDGPVLLLGYAKMTEDEIREGVRLLGELVSL